MVTHTIHLTNFHKCDLSSFTQCHTGPIVSFVLVPPQPQFSSNNVTLRFPLSSVCPDSFVSCSNISHFHYTL